jgi:hypothetical protein
MNWFRRWLSRCRILTAAFIAFACPTLADEHDARWIHENHPACCDHRDCFEIPDANVLYDPMGFWAVRWLDHVFFVEEQQARKTAPWMKNPWVCERKAPGPIGYAVRCLFVKPRGM